VESEGGEMGVREGRMWLCSGRFDRDGCRIEEMTENYVETHASFRIS
jgi:hypothetical protein